jgi:hypothetical protein
MARLNANVRRHSVNSRAIVIGIGIGVLSSSAYGKVPNCSGPDRWPASMAFVHLKNAGITNNEKVDFSKTKAVRIASQKTGRDLYRQVHRITFVEITGKLIEVITVNDASNEECSMSAVDVYVVSQRLGGK